jgi:hypothetical protein
MVKTSTRIVGALALAGALLTNGPVSAAQPTPALEGDLSANRMSAEVIFPLVCAAVQPPANDTKTASVSVKIFQSVGRLLNIGTATEEGLPCTGNSMNVTVTVDAIDGLKFQPGPATILFTVTEQTTASVGGTVSSSPPVDTGAKINLRP